MSDWILVGLIIPAKPSTPRRLNKSLPSKFPIAIPCFSLNAAVNDVASSGAEVPAATIVTAITQSETPKALARFDACSGARKTLPAIRPVQSFPVEIRDGEIYVDVG